MSKLSNFSIETDHIVFLQFKNGQELRVPVSQLTRHLDSSDLGRVSEALKLRRDFLRTHMPKTGFLLVLAASTVAAVIVTQGMRVATQILQRGAILAPVPTHDTIYAQPIPVGPPSGAPSGSPASHTDLSKPVVPAPTLHPYPQSKFKSKSKSQSLRVSVPDIPAVKHLPVSNPHIPTAALTALSTARDQAAVPPASLPEAVTAPDSNKSSQLPGPSDEPRNSSAAKPF